MYVGTPNFRKLPLGGSKLNRTLHSFSTHEEFYKGCPLTHGASMIRYKVQQTYVYIYVILAYAFIQSDTHKCCIKNKSYLQCIIIIFFFLLFCTTTY